MKRKRRKEKTERKETYIYIYISPICRKNLSLLDTSKQESKKGELFFSRKGMKKENQKGESQNKRETIFQETEKDKTWTNISKKKKKEPSKKGNRQNCF